MSDFIRRMMQGTAILRQAEGEGTPADNNSAPSADAGSDPNAGEVGASSHNPTSPGASDDGTPPENQPGETQPPAAASPAAPDKAQQRITQLVAERWTERRRAEAAEQRERLLQEQLNQTRQALQQPQVDADGNPVQHQQPAPPTAPVIPQNAQDLQRMAADIAAQNEFNRQVGAEVGRGRTLHQDFDQVAANLQRFGELPRSFVEAAMATGKGAEVIYQLGNDVIEADRILSLPPMQQAVALATLATGIKAPEPPKTVTSAPAPVVPKVSGGRTINTPTLEDENLPIADWIKLREKNLPKRASR